MILGLYLGTRCWILETGHALSGQCEVRRGMLEGELVLVRTRQVGVLYYPHMRIPRIVQLYNSQNKSNTQTTYAHQGLFPLIDFAQDLTKFEIFSAASLVFASQCDARSCTSSVRGLRASLAIRTSCVSSLPSSAWFQRLVQYHEKIFIGLTNLGCHACQSELEPGSDKFKLKVSII